MGESAAANRAYGMREKLPIIMFCGFPVMVATLPILAAMATASRYGTGLRRSLPVISTTRGVRTRHMVSLTKKAEKMPATRTIPINRGRGRWAWRTTQALTTAKNPESRRLATTIIMPNSSRIVS